MAALIICLIFYLPLKDTLAFNKVIGEYYYLTSDFHHPTFFKLRLEKNYQFKIEASRVSKYPRVITKGEYLMYGDILILTKRKMIFEEKRGIFKKRHLTNCTALPDEFGCQLDTFLVKEEGFYEYQYFANPKRRDWVLTYRRIEE